MKKSIIAIIAMVLVFVTIFILSYIFLPNKNDITYIATIKRIENGKLLVEELPGDSENYARLGVCYVSIGKTTLILDKENNIINLTDLEVGDTIIIISKPGIITYTDPGWIDDIKLVKAVYKATNEI